MIWTGSFLCRGPPQTRAVYLVTLPIINFLSLFIQVSKYLPFGNHCVFLRKGNTISKSERLQQAAILIYCPCGWLSIHHRLRETKSRDTNPNRSGLRALSSPSS